MSKISELSDGGVIQGGDTLIAVRSGGNVKVTYGGTTTANIDGGTIDGTTIGGTTPAAGSFTTGSFTGDVSFGDNDKAIFGAGPDLRIYHDGSNSYINDTSGTGNLYIASNQLIINNAANSENMARFTENGAATLYFDGSAKLATTSTGIDVTGTVTADGLTVDGASDLNGNVTVGSSITTLLTGNDIEFQRAGDSYLSQTGGGALNIRTNDGVSNKARMNLASNGDISFYEDTGTTAKLFWDASAESLGIGATSLTHTLHVTGSSNEMGLFKRSAAGNSEVKIDTTTSGDAKLTFASDGTAAFTMGRDNSDSSFRIASGGTLGSNDRLVINTSGNVGIGTDSPNYKLDVRNGVIAVGSGSNTSQTNTLLQGYGFHIGSTLYGNTSIRSTYENSGNAASLEFYTSSGGSSTTERMRIDSSGNLLVGTTSSTAGITATSGNSFVYRPTAELTVARQGSGATSPVAIFNQTGDDGQILDFRKDGTSVGSIGTNSDRVYISDNAQAGISFASASQAIIPCTSSGATNDNAVDLGMSVIRYKDLYLSGGAYLGGTGSANKLDDYEEGTWTPALWQGTHTYTAQTGSYVKIGKMVTVFGQMKISSRGSSTSEFGISGLPFASSGVTSAYASVLGIHSGYGNAPLLPTGVDPTGVSVESTRGYFRTTHTTNSSYVIDNLNASGEVTFAFTYEAA